MGSRCGDGIGSASAPDVELIAGPEVEPPATSAPRLSHGAHPRVRQLVVPQAAGVRVRAVRVRWHRISMSITVYIYIGAALGLRNQLYIPIHTLSKAYFRSHVYITPSGFGVSTGWFDCHYPRWKMPVSFDWGKIRRCAPVGVLSRSSRSYMYIYSRTMSELYSQSSLLQIYLLYGPVHRAVWRKKIRFCAAQ